MERNAMMPDSRLSQTTEISAAEILSRSRRLVAPALREAITRLHPWLGRMAAFTFGWVEPDGTPRPSAGEVGGKGLRPALVLLSARAAGASSTDAAVTGAVAVELVHAFSLVHDDIMDGDEQRRHRETAWKAYGVGPAVLAGDALLALAMGTLARTPGAGVCDAMERLSASLVDLVGGQAQDIAFESRPWTGPDAVTVDEYLAMAEAKTGALLGCAAAVGTLLGGGSPARATAMARMGRHLGLAFQMADDLLGIWGDPAVTGKPAFGDLGHGKKTLPVLAALEAGTKAAGRLARLLACGPADPDTYRAARDLIDEAGGRAFAQEQAGLHLDRALRILDGTRPAEGVSRELAGLCRFLVSRSH
jgi:geranylgeranyl diphosphate synthase, type I